MQPLLKGVDQRVKIQPWEYASDNLKQTDSSFSTLIENSEIMKDALGKNGTFGVIFPYTPIFAFAAISNYSEYQTTHSNDNLLSYSFSNIAPFTLTANFTCSTGTEARYSLACVHFFRTVTKSRFGKNDEFRGAPPPLLQFSAYGDLIIKRAPVVISSFLMTFPDDVDYVDIKFNDYETRLPIYFTISLEIKPQYLPYDQFENFNITEFAKGSLLKNKGYI